MRKLVASTAVAAALVGCGGDGDDPASRPTATPSGTPVATPPAGLDVEAINAARDSFVRVCEQREEGKANDTDTMRRLRAAAHELTDGFEASPDDPFRRSANTPAVTMRERLRSLALVARRQCGGGAAVRLGDRLARTATRDDG